MAILYKHVNKENGKIYYGQTTGTAKKRWGKNGNRYKQDTIFYRAIEKYGWDNFEHIIIADNLTEDEAKEFEQYYIARDKTNVSRWGKNANGYNMTDGGEGQKGHKQNPETIEKRASKHRGKKHNQEWCENISKGNKGKHKKGHPQTEKSKQKISNTRKGIQYSEETKAKMSKAKLGNTVNNKKVKQLSTGLIFNSGKEASKYLGHNAGYISQKIARGDKDWIYLEEENV